jgi:hypothetical protein
MYCADSTQITFSLCLSEEHKVQYFAQSACTESLIPLVEEEGTHINTQLYAYFRKVSQKGGCSSVGFGIMDTEITDTVDSSEV